MSEKDMPMVKYGVDESELTIVKTAGRAEMVTPSREYHVTTSDKRVKAPWLKKKADR